MYRFDWIEQLKLRGLPGAVPGRLQNVSPVVWALGLTSLLTDISSEMVSSVLPTYLVLHLRLSPIQYGAIDGIYNGLSVALAAIAAGVLADRLVRRKEVAAAGYGLSAICKLLLLGTAGAWSWIALVVGLDRVGKSIRTAPRDALLSLHTSPGMMGTAFGVHRALDSCGALLGPLVAVVLLAQLPGAFDTLWTVSFIVALMGIAALWLLVPGAGAGRVAVQEREEPTAASRRRFIGLAACGTALAFVTISDGFIYLLLQEKSGLDGSLVPVYFIVTAASYMLFSIPIGVLADRFGRAAVFISGYVVLGVLYLLLLSTPNAGFGAQCACLLLLGLYYAGTEGVLMASASTVVAARRRATGLAVLATCIGLGKLGSSLLFGWAAEALGTAVAIRLFAAALFVIVVGCVVWLRVSARERA